VNDILREALARDLNGATNVTPGLHDRIDGLEHLDKVIDIDQTPIGRTPRSNPATYIKVFDEIRDLFCKLPDAKVRGYRPGRFSFNVSTGEAGGGRCEACEGNGSNKMDMDFLADVWVTCPVCNGNRFSLETLQILYKGKTISDVLNMDVQQAFTHFENVPKIAGKLQTLHDVGLDYLKLGQASTTLSGGEAQRIKLARELVKRPTGRTLYLLDEPTTGLHFADVKRLLTVLQSFVDAGNTVLVIEHHLDVVKTADWVIDLGPEGGEGGGRVVAEGTPEDIARCETSHTGMTLREFLKPTRVKKPAGATASAKPPRGKTALRSPTSSILGDTGELRAITVVGAKQHNLKDITVEIPRGTMTVCCGPSGSGKSSLAIDTVYTEGQRRYVESLSAYARQFLSRLQPPKVDHVFGLSPAICIEQRTASASPRSTVGTITEIYDYLRILWSRIGEPFCPECRVPVGAQGTDEIVGRVLALGDGRKVLLLAPLQRGENETYEQLFARQRQNGFARVRVDGEIHELAQSSSVNDRRRHTVELVVDRVLVKKSQIARVTDSVEQALTVGEGVMFAQVVEENGEGKVLRFSRHRSCNQCGKSFDELSPHHFSFNTRLGWCETCEGLGTQTGAATSAVVVHPTRSIAEGAIAGWGNLEHGSKLHELASAVARHIGVSTDQPWHELPEPKRLKFLHGCGEEWIEIGGDVESGDSKCSAGWKGQRVRWRGFYPAIDRASRVSWDFREKLAGLAVEVPCEACLGSRIRKDAAAVRVERVTLREVCSWPMKRAADWFAALKLDARRRKIAGELLHEIGSRLTFLVNVGLDYISLERTASTLSGGESQRIQLASQIGTGLTGVLYVLDEPTIGLHPRDNTRLIVALKKLRDLGNTLLLVEHDREVIDSADHVLDFGPGAGAEGGTITAADSPSRIRKQNASLTGRYLSNREAIGVPSNRRPVPDTTETIVPARRYSTEEWADDEFDDDMEATLRPRRRPKIKKNDGEFPWLVVHRARENNLKGIDAAFPLGRLTCVTGVSGSGKSTLISDILYKALAARLHRARVTSGAHDHISGTERIDKVINVDQTPLGNSPTSNPATYTGLFDEVRELFAMLPLSKVRGYTANRYSFNRPGGRCEACEGMGQRRIEMHFLPDVWIECEECKGARYVTETLDVRFRSRSIADVLSMRVTEALELFESVPGIRRMLQTLDDVGLGYLQLGQPAPTLSGGEAQRVKLAAELGRPSTGKTLYILDEPTTGLHFDDIKKLLLVLHRLVDLGNTCICIEHNLDVIKTADWVIDLGPEAGEKGGRIVAAGTPEQVAKSTGSYTGVAIRPILDAGPKEERMIYRPAPVVTEQAVRAATKAALGGDLRMPWERDGKAWHSEKPVDADGEPVAWDPKVLEWLIDTTESLGEFAPTDWNHRTRIEITAGRDQPWFCHVLTRSKDLLHVSFRVAAGTFDSKTLGSSLGIKKLDERTDLTIYGQEDRVRVRDHSDGWQEVRLHVRDFIDVNKTAFRSFLKTAVEGYAERLKREEERIVQGEPWETDGEQWHLSQRSILKRHKKKWKPDLLLAMIGRFRLIDSRIELDWATRTAVKLSLPREKLYTAKIVTNLGRGLRIEIRAPKGRVTPAQIDRLGDEVDIRSCPNNDFVTFWIRTLEQNDLKQFRDLWRLIAADADVERLRSA
ncbi:MAG: excinuclease ABC subunit A, partial [Planctomycetota bacterium]